MKLIDATKISARNPQSRLKKKEKTKKKKMIKKEGKMDNKFEERGSIEILMNPLETIGGRGGRRIDFKLTSGAGINF